MTITIAIHVPRDSLHWNVCYFMFLQEYAVTMRLQQLVVALLLLPTTGEPIVSFEKSHYYVRVLDATTLDS